MTKSKLFLITLMIIIKISLLQNRKVKKLKNPINQKEKTQKLKNRKLQTTNPSESSSSNNEGYYQDTDGTRKKCYESCKYCYGDPDIETGEMNCRLCIDNYYFIRNTTNCINETEASTMSNIFILRDENRNIQYFIKCYSSCQSCNGIYDEENDNHNCLSCNDNYYFVSQSNNCYDESYVNNGYYLNEGIFYKCKYNCKTCSQEGLSENDQKCTSCYDEYYLENENCILINDEDNKNKNENDDTINNGCNKGLYYFKGYCYSNCPKNTFKYISSNICVYNCPKGTIGNNENQICEIDIDYNNLSIKEITNLITSSIKDFNSPEYIIKTKDYAIQFYDIDIEEFAKEIAYDKKISTIDFNECGNFLKQYYQIDNILLLKIDTINEKSIVDNINYFAYDYNGNELDISLCNSISINVVSPIKNNNLIDLNEAMELANLNYDIFNTSDEFYNDLCTRFSSKKGTDVILEDRRNNYYQNISLCDDECEYNGIDYENMIVNCKCLSKNHKSVNESLNNNDLSLNVNNAKNAFKNNLKSSNIYVMKCSNLVFNKKFFYKNIGFWIMTSFYLSLLILFFIYLKNGLKKIMNYLKVFEPKNNPPKKKSINSNQNIYENNNLENENTKSKRKEMENIPTSDNLILHSNENNNNIKDEYEKNESNKEIYEDEDEQNYASTNIYIKKISSPHIKINTIKIKPKNSFNSIQSSFKNSNSSIIQSNQETNINQKKKSYSNEELFDLSYEESLIYDKRKYIIIYWNYLELQHIIINTFILESFLELRIIKIYFLIFSFGLEFTLNALFYTDEYISDMYYNDGVLDFISNLPKSIYSFLVTILINFFLVKLSNSKNELKNILSHTNSKEDFNLICEREFKYLKKKLIIFFLLTFLFMLFFWYYSCSFCAVYYNSQKYWAIGGLESFVMNLISPFILCFFLSLLRFFSLRKKIKLLYIIEQIINKFI